MNRKKVFVGKELANFREFGRGENLFHFRGIGFFKKFLLFFDNRVAVVGNALEIFIKCYHFCLFGVNKAICLI